MLAVLFCITLQARAQNTAVTGKVTTANGESLPGVNVLLKGSNTGTITDAEGNYRISATEGTLVFSFIGYSMQEVPVSGRTTIDVVMEEDVTTLEQVVVVGYGVQKRKDITTSVVVVDQSAIENRPMVSAAEALQGKAAGVQVVQPSGKPGGDISVRVRGSTSVQAGNEPLYVIDGVPTTDTRGLNPNDIATLTVLKDASSAAIYGARAANGVVLITTKRGAAGTPVLRFNATMGVSKMGNTLDVLSTEQYRELMEEVQGPGSVDPAITQNTDWQKEVFGTGSFQNYQLSYSGGDEKNQFYVSGGYLKNKGIIRPSQYDRYSFRLNLDNQVQKWLKIGTNLNFVQSNYKNTEDNKSSGRGGVIMSALNTPPFLNVYKPDGSGQFDPNPFQASWENPVAYMEGADEGTTDNRLIGNISGQIDIIEGLSFKTNFGIDYTVHRFDYFLDPFRTVFGRDPTNHGIGRAERSSTFAWLSENTLNYSKSFGVNNFSVLAGVTTQESTWERSYIEGKDFPSVPGVQTLNAANQILTALTEETDWAIYSFLARVNYDYDGKYLVSAAIRRDGSSRFAAGHQWGTFPSISAGWRISAEPFMQNVEVINDLKLRGGWGKNGNQEGINNYASYSQYSFARQSDLGGGPLITREGTLGTENISWEETTQANLGIDLSLFNSRLTFTIDAYLKKTDGLLLDLEPPDYTGYDFVRMNAGSMENKGLEFSVSSVNVERDEFTWNTDFNISFNRNKVTDLQLNEIYYFAPIYSNGDQNVVIMKPGVSLGTFYGYIADGVNPETGNMMYRDINDNGVLNEADRTIIGNAQPKFIFGMTNVFSYKRFGLNVFLQGTYGNDIYNSTRVDLEGMFDSKNQSTAVLNRWTESNRNTSIPRAGLGTESVRNSTRFIEDGSYLRVKSITLSYNIDPQPLKKLGINKLSVFTTGQNLLTMTNYSGFDPEVNAFSANGTNTVDGITGGKGTEIGVDYGTYPQSKTIIFGVNVEF
jgi:TonB-linked SusC/RagA family outer membrane protein